MESSSTCLCIMIVLMINRLPFQSAEDTENCVKQFENHNEDKLENGKQDNSPWTEHKNTCQQEQKTNDKVLLFKSPEYVWGKEFNTTISKTVCESNVYARGDNVECIRYTKKGMSACSKVCNKQDQNILRIAPTTVVLKDYYCTKKRLKAATCVCVFKVTCQEFNHFVFVHFIPNRTGDVAMIYFEAGHPINTTL